MFIPPARIFAIAFLALLIFLRAPWHFLNPQFYAEDGCVFFRDAWNLGFLKSLAEPYSGYLHAVPRLVAGLAILAPLEQAPLVFSLAALAIALVPLLYLLSARLSPQIPSFAARVLSAALLAALPALILLAVRALAQRSRLLLILLSGAILIFILMHLFPIGGVDIVRDEPYYSISPQHLHGPREC